MAAHKLNLFFPDSLDCRVLQIQDISTFDINTPVTNPVIKILIPGNDCPFYPVMKIKGTNYFTSNAFGLTDASCSLDLQSLPDGLYDITFSICPNDTVYYRTKIMRTCVLRNEVMNNLSRIIISSCGDKVYDCFGKDITLQRVKDLKDLLLLLDLAELDARNFKYSEATDKVKYVSKQISTC